MADLALVISAHLLMPGSCARVSRAASIGRWVAMDVNWLVTMVRWPIRLDVPTQEHLQNLDTVQAEVST